jgi:hypothetical protein
MVLLPLLQWRHCRPQAGIIALVAMASTLVVKASLPSMRRHLCHCKAGILALRTMVSLPLIHDGVVALVAMALLLSTSWHCRPHCNGTIVIINAQASSPSSQWHCCPCCDGVVAIDA